LIYKNLIKIKINDIYLFIIGIILILIAGLRPIGIDRDSVNYVDFLKIIGNHNIVFEDFLQKEPMFWIINKFNYIFFHGNIHIFFLIFAILGISLKLYAIRQLSTNILISLLSYILLFFILFDMTQIRVGVAIGIFLLSIPDIINNSTFAHKFQ